MDKYKKTISGVVMGTILIGGAYYYSKTVGIEGVEPLEAPATVELDIEDSCKTHEQLRIVPTEKLESFQEGSFTLNDITYEITREASLHGTNSERYGQLRDLHEKVELRISEIPEHCRGNERVAEEPLFEDAREAIINE